MTLFGKTIITIVVLVLGGIGTFAYMTRPVALPTENIEENQATTTNLSSTASDSSENSSNSSSTSSSASVVSYRIAQGTKAEFNIQEVLRGEDFVAVGTTSNVSGTIQVDLNNPEDSVIGTIKINARTFKTDSPNRDSAIARFILKSEDPANEFITFTTKEISNMPSDAPSKVEKGEPITFKIKGDLTVAGITKSATFDARFLLAKNGQIQGTAESKIKRSDFNLTIPNVPFVASVSDEFLIKINAVLAK